jgi:hypothetical protein
MPLYCPICAAALEEKLIRIYGTFQCPKCGEKLRVPIYYVSVGFWGSVLLSSLLSAAAGFRGITLCLVTVVFWLPTAFVLARSMRVLWPPKIVRSLPDNLTMFP